jgi:hypothetical protein
VLFPYIFGEFFEKNKETFELVIVYFQILQQCQILCNKNADCKKRNTQKPNISIYIYITKNHDL